MSPVSFYVSWKHRKNLSFYTPWKHQKISGFLKFSGCIEREGFPMFLERVIERDQRHENMFNVTKKILQFSTAKSQNLRPF